MDDTYKRRVMERLETRPRLIPMFTNAHDIPEQVYHYNKEFFMVYNRVKDKYELHSLANPLDTYEMTVPFKELDIRFIRYIWKQDLRVHGKNLFYQLEKLEEQNEKSRMRKFRNWARDVASETQSLFAKDAWTM